MDKTTQTVSVGLRPPHPTKENIRSRMNTEGGYEEFVVSANRNCPKVVFRRTEKVEGHLSTVHNYYVAVAICASEKEADI